MPTPVVPRRIRCAFTLVEMLVVIGIILLLVAILFPVFGRVRENARRKVCMSNLKQIGRGIMQYTQDYDENLPLTSRANGANSQILNPMTERVWATNPPTVSDWYPNTMFGIFPYVKTAAVYHCQNAPAATSPASLVPGGLNDISYMYNEVLTTFPGTASSAIYGVNPASIFFSSRKLSEFSRVSQIVAFQEYPLRTNRLNFLPYLSGLTNSGPYWARYFPFYYNSASPPPMHFDGVNVLFVDGHVKWRKNESLHISDFGLAYVNAPTQDLNWDSGVTTALFGVNL